MWGAAAAAAAKVIKRLGHTQEPSISNARVKRIAFLFRLIVALPFQRSTKETQQPQEEGASASSESPVLLLPLLYYTARVSNWMRAPPSQILFCIAAQSPFSCVSFRFSHQHLFEFSKGNPLLNILDPFYTCPTPRRPERMDNNAIYISFFFFSLSY